jgi:hypothetical protein
MTADPMLDEGKDHHDWGFYFYLCRDTPRYRSIAEQEWAAVQSLALPPSTFVAVQQDSHDGIRRWCGSAGQTPYRPRTLGKGNQGCVDVAKSFLNWAGARASSTRSVLVLAGTGVLDPWSIVGSEDDPTRTFAICDDSSANDALEISELKAVLQDRKTRKGRPFDVLVCDMSAMQWLEVAYQFDELVNFVVAAQSPITPGICQVDKLVQAFSTDNVGQDPARGARRAAEVLGEAYRARTGSGLRKEDIATAPSTVSVLNLSALQPVSRAFDTFSHALMLALGEEIVWTTREEIAKRARMHPFGSAPTGPWSSAFFQEFAYDLVGLMDHSKVAFAEAQQGAISRSVARYLLQLDERTLFNELASIDERINHVVSDLMDDSMSRAPSDSYRTFFRTWGEMIRSERKDRSETSGLLASLGDLPAAVRDGDDEFWTDWVSELNAPISATLRRQIEVTNEGKRHAKRLGTLAARVLTTLKCTPDASDSDSFVIDKYPRESPACGIAIYRPRKLDTLLNANYLKLDFNRRSHWTALLAVINLVQGHARAMWRVIESVLSTAPLDARA